MQNNNNEPKNPYNDEMTREAVAFLYEKLKALNPDVSKNSIHEWYIKNRIRVEAEYERLAAEGKDFPQTQVTMDIYSKSLDEENQ